MLLWRRRGFTLIELLVVIAIIGILAAMLFPVFARARESARKIQCLSNVKNIAMAFQMYLTDYDRFPPTEHRPEVVDYFGFGCCNDQRLAAANPYLKYPVLLDEYIKNRDVWSCPSTPILDTYPILNPYLNSTGKDDWFLTWQEQQSNCPRPRACNFQFPPGWGGPVTDSRQGGVWCTPPVGGGAFSSSIGVVLCRDMSTSQVNDAARRVVCGDGQSSSGGWPFDCTMTLNMAYPDMCRIRCASADEGCGADWVNCPQTQTCSPPYASIDPEKYKYATDPAYRKAHVPQRHLGGSNLGFADGHAKWMNSEAILFGGQPTWIQPDASGELEGLDVCIDTNRGY
jgi:prepilin-type N-terminal cleavage/methylation domain-containing protein/prepilin-type processing-associated H-X9-DG protein